LTQSATPEPLLVIKPEEAIVQSGKEVRLSISDGQVSASDHSTFKLDYDSEILHFKRLDNAEVINIGKTMAADHGEQSGTITFQFTRPTQHAPRTVSVTFEAKAPGVSPIRVELTRAGNTAQASTEIAGTGVVRVR
jgi:general secretion pathway protein D